tara:strand:- start:4266 stop:4859 length:594 start_codon:yes stop_codon:yes gene_type:complete
MISYLVKGLDGNPIMSSTVLMASVYALSIAPMFTRDAYLKMLPIFLIPVVMISSSDSTGFAMNIELILAAGIISAIYIKILDYFERTKRLLKDPQVDKFMSSMVYISVFAVFMMAYVGGGKVTGVPLHAGLPQAKSPAYFFLMFIYLIITLASTTGLQLGIGGNSKKKESEPVVVTRTVVQETPAPEEDEDDEEEDA